MMSRKNPSVFSAYDAEFKSNGNILYDAISCTVIKGLDGTNELELIYPAEGKHARKLQLQEIILASADNTDQPQPYRIYRIQKSINKTVIVNAAHVAYDLIGAPADSIIQALTPVEVMDALQQANDKWGKPFKFITQNESSILLNNRTPKSIWAYLFGKNSLSEKGIEIKFDRFTVEALTGLLGKDTGFKIKYGSNMTDFLQVDSDENVYIGAFPYGVTNDGYWYGVDELKYPNGVIYYGAPSGTFEKIQCLDLTSQFNEAGHDDFTKIAENYIEKHPMNIPEITYSVSFARLRESEEYKTYKGFEDIELGDIVTVEFPLYRLTAKARCSQTVYDAIAHRYVKAEIGTYRKNIADTIAELERR